MKVAITKNARNLIAVITKEYKLQQDRVAGGHIPADQLENCLTERLHAIARRDPSMRAFLTYVGPIDPRDDDDPNKPWAKDPRMGRRHVVLSKRDKAEGSLGGGPNFEDDRPWPSPGERIA